MLSGEGKVGETSIKVRNPSESTERWPSTRRSNMESVPHGSIIVRMLHIIEVGHIDRTCPVRGTTSDMGSLAV